MRLFKSYLLMLIAAFVMVGCADNFDRPPIVEPTAANADKVNTTIYDLKFKYWDDARNYIDTIGQTEAGEDIIIKGRVVSSDETGNIYKSLAELKFCKAFSFYILVARFVRIAISDTLATSDLVAYRGEMRHPQLPSATEGVFILPSSLDNIK